MSFDWGSVLGALGTAAGAYYGGAEGAQAGGAVGSGVGSMFGDDSSATAGTGTSTAPAAVDANTGEDGFDWTSVILPVIAGATSLFGQVAEGDVKEQELKDKEKQANLNTMLNLQLEALKMKYAQPALPTPIWNPTKMKQGERVSMQQSANLAQVNQLNNLMSSYQKAVGR